MTGLPAKRKLGKNYSETDQYWVAVVSEWQGDIDGAPVKDSDERFSATLAQMIGLEPMPVFDKANAFIFKGGNYVDVSAPSTVIPLL